MAGEIFSARVFCVLTEFIALPYYNEMHGLSNKLRGLQWSRFTLPLRTGFSYCCAEV